MDDKTLALLGDSAAAERLTERGELLGCPSCKSQDIRMMVAGDMVCPICNDCCYAGTFKRGERNARIAWNTRAPILTPIRMALLQIAEGPRKFEEGT
ncbi:hypothetical protein B5E80_18870 [Flavonifractor sp. An135]|nr:hypothetical protein [Flavonifractor sp. An135]OUQ16779.1 hypothetical protein B5E80_18870 [Flavonifractor sp. An135]